MDVGIYDVVRESVMEAMKYKFQSLADDDKARFIGNADDAYDLMTDNGEFHEAVDGCVPIYYRDIVDAWLELGLPEAEDFGGYCDEKDIIKQMNIGIYYALDDFARRSFPVWHEEYVGSISEGEK